MNSRWLGYSIVLHGLAILLMIECSHFVEAPPKITKEVIDFEVHSVQAKKMTSAASTDQRDVPRKSGKSSSSGKQIQLFGQDYIAGSASKGMSTGDGFASWGDYTDSASYLIGSDNFIGENDQWEFFRQVYERIDSHLIFDSLLAQYNHFGIVFVEFEVDVQGKLLGDHLKVSSEDSILKVHVLRALRKGLKEPFVREKWNPTGKSSVMHSKFEFVNDNGSLNSFKQKQFGKPILAFKRATSEAPAANTVTDAVISKETILNPYLIGEHLEKYKQKKMRDAGDLDPFWGYRRDPDYNL
ncbi:MAG: hypothetical protein J7501_07740 [Bdellovibrio sp.]|nr:hypothetical protein [Bdellovibrio sp.]